MKKEEKVDIKFKKEDKAHVCKVEKKEDAENARSMKDEKKVEIKVKKEDGKQEPKEEKKEGEKTEPGVKKEEKVEIKVEKEAGPIGPPVKKENNDYSIKKEVKKEENCPSCVFTGTQPSSILSRKAELVLISV